MTPEEELEYRKRYNIPDGAPIVEAPAPTTKTIADSENIHRQQAIINPVAQPTPIYELPPRPEKPAGYGDYGWFNDFSNDYFETPLTPEERARRERAAYISSGVANLGNAIGALGNMFAARGGAPAQKLPTMPDVDQKVSAFRQHADKVRDDYLRSRMSVQRARDDAFDREDARWLRLKQANDLDEYREASNEIKRMRVETERALQDAKNKYWEARARGEDERANWYAARAYEAEQLLGYKIHSEEANAYQRNTAALRNLALKGKYESQTGPKVVTKSSRDPLTGQEVVETSTTSYGGQPGVVYTPVQEPTSTPTPATNPSGKPSSTDKNKGGRNKQKGAVNSQRLSSFSIHQK